MLSFTSNVLWYVALFAGLLALARVLSLRAPTRYAFLLMYLAAVTVRSSALHIIGVQGPLYPPVFILTEPVLLALETAFVVEVYILIASKYGSALGAYRQWVMIGLLAFCFAATIGTALLTDLLFVSSNIITLVVAVKSVVTFALGSFVVLAAAFFFVRVPERRNIVVHRWITAGYCFSQAIGHGLISAYRDPAYNTLMLAGTTACLLSWAVFLKPSGEQWPAPDFSDADKDALRARKPDALACLKVGSV